ncbi:MAG: sugar ABC transporter substrate-binding protein [Phycisphaerae bacterium]|jgi:ribose transport system substrate-binding protein|nr:sugar ABC transporter substrate-binding protein [Phycisphaerae bacterium]
MRNSAIAVLVSVLVMGMLTGCGKGSSGDPDGRKKIVFIGYSSTNTFWITLKNSAEKTAKDAGLDFADMTSSEPDIVAQKAAVDNAIRMGVAGLVIGPSNSEGLGKSLDKAKAAGIPVVTVDTRVKHDWISSHVATDNVAAAELAGDYIVGKLGGKGKVLIIGGTVGAQTADDRRNGVFSKCKAAGMTVLHFDANWKDDEANRIAQAQLAAHNDIGAIFAACDPMILGAKVAVKRKGLLGKVLLVGFDAIPEALAAVQKGELDATVRQDPVRMGKEGVQLMAKILKGETDIPKSIAIKAVIVNKSNVDEYIK